MSFIENLFPHTIIYDSKRKNPAKLQALFEAIAKEKVGTFKLVKERFQTKYQMVIPYLNEEIFVQNDLGMQETGLLVCYLPILERDMTFKIDERFLFFSKMIKRKKDYLYVKSKNVELEEFIKNSDSFSVLNELAKADAFQPVIYGEKVNEYYRIETRYHLDFLTRREVVEPLVNFYISLLEFYYND